MSYFSKLKESYNQYNTQKQLYWENLFLKINSLYLGFANYIGLEGDDIQKHLQLVPETLPSKSDIVLQSDELNTQIFSLILILNTEDTTTNLPDKNIIEIMTIKRVKDKLFIDFQGKNFGISDESECYTLYDAIYRDMLSKLDTSYYWF